MGEDVFCKLQKLIGRKLVLPNLSAWPKIRHKALCQPSFMEIHNRRGVHGPRPRPSLAYVLFFVVLYYPYWAGASGHVVQGSFTIVAKLGSSRVLLTSFLKQDRPQV